MNNSMIIKKTLLFVLAIFFCGILYAVPGDFVINHIRVDGLQGLSQETVLSYIPVKAGQQFNMQQSREIISALYKTNFFDDVQLSHDGTTLIVSVVQRPIIGQVTITGNSAISTKQFIDALKKLHFYEGDVFNPAVLEQVKDSLEGEYFSLGKYNAGVDIKTTSQPGHRVFVVVTISEGQAAKIKQIKIIGNNAFSETELLNQFKLTPAGLLTFYSHNDQYSREKLVADLEALRSYYMNRGYIKFNIETSQVSISPDRKQVYITIRITEGGQYTLSGYTFTGHSILTKDQLSQAVLLKKGQVFSRQDILEASKRISQLLGNKGYSNADVEAIPRIDDLHHTVFLNFNITPGARIYVRHITFSENYRTNDEVLRREVQQVEGGVLSTQKLEDSKRSLLLLPYISQANVTTQPVPGSRDQVDVNYKVAESPSAELQGGVGYSVLNKLMFNASVQQRNLFGTGNSLNLNFMYSRPSTELSVNYYNPYYTASGMGRTISAYTTHSNLEEANVANYVTNDYGLSVGYNWPVSLNNSLQFGYGYENTILKLGNNASTELLHFVDRHHRNFNEFDLNGGWTYQGLDRYLFPTQGVLQTLNVMASAPAGGQTLEYYTLEDTVNFYHPLYHDFIGNIKLDLGYANGYGTYGGKLPFFKNYFAGGIGSVRGYEGNTIGPLDSNNNPLGGNIKMVGTQALIFPNPFGDTLRTSIFLDEGDVFSTPKENHQDGIKLNELRYSTGVEIDWRSPIALLNFSLATPIRERNSDQSEYFQFNIGSSM
ncbi:MAG: outer membrane protein assembly factor BamA [Gammaproteobacteria bacterium GWF2_41_13]|nr:MAG: outer membrane protein assembly factor BamA [Gammaproteobacteria bacterium GWF2_41_13]